MSLRTDDTPGEAVRQALEEMVHGGRSPGERDRLNRAINMIRERERHQFLEGLSTGLHQGRIDHTNVLSMVAREPVISIRQSMTIMADLALESMGPERMAGFIDRLDQVHRSAVEMAVRAGPNWLSPQQVRQLQSHIIRGNLDEMTERLPGFDREDTGQVAALEIALMTSPRPGDGNMARGRRIMARLEQAQSMTPEERARERQILHLME